jgi:peptide/nickel transport system permease protein
MFAFILRRLVAMIGVLVGVGILTFVISHVVPADPAVLLAGGPRATPADVAAVRHRLGLDRPLIVQFFSYALGLLHGDLGTSITTQHPVLSDFALYFPATVELAVTAWILAAVVGIPLGVVSAVHRGRWIDHLTRVLAVSSVAMPLFWLAILLQLVFYGRLGILPVGERIDASVGVPPHVTGLYTVDSLLHGSLPQFLSSVRHLILPASTLAFGSLAGLVRVGRASMLEALRQDYVRTARAKGLRRYQVIYVHALRNALIPTVTLLSLGLANLLSGAFLIEVVFSWPGIGEYSVQAVQNFDYQPIVSVTLLIAAIYVFVNLIADLLYAALDPRIRYS